MTESTLGHGGASRRAMQAGPPDWATGFGHWHRIAVGGLLIGLLCAHAFGMLSVAGGGAVLLGGGALIGIPHGSSDFVVAGRWLRPRLGGAWLPCFLGGYLAISAVMIVGWIMAPATTFGVFLAISGWHFGADQNGNANGGAMVLARATTPVLPIFLLHSTEVAGIIGLMSHRPAAVVAAFLRDIQPAGLTLYAVLLIGVTVAAVGRMGRPGEDLPAVVELVLLAVAAAVLPPLITFAVYFCLIHAVGHMAHLGSQIHPHDGHGALRLAALIVVPSALACCLALGFAWTAIAGVVTTEPLLALALQVTATLTVPHVLMEGATPRGSKPAAP